MIHIQNSSLIHLNCIPVRCILATCKFLGYALIQLPEMLLSVYEYVKKRGFCKNLFKSNTINATELTIVEERRNSNNKTNANTIEDLRETNPQILDYISKRLDEFELKLHQVTSKRMDEFELKLQQVTIKINKIS